MKYSNSTLFVLQYFFNKAKDFSLEIWYNYCRIGCENVRKIVDGNIACSSVAYLFSEVATIYPITPSSPMASHVDEMSSKEHYNLFHDKVHVTEMQSEAGAAGAMHGALMAGSLASTFTASQGLLLMIPNMYKIAGECLPGVIHVAARTVATHALSIFGDHSDVYATRCTGFCMLASSNVEQAYHLAAVAHLSAIKGSLPFLHFFDGFRTSHELNTIEPLSESALMSLVDKKKLQEFKDRSLNVGKSVQYGMSETEDIYFQSVEARSELYEVIPGIVNDYMEKINELADTNYKPFNYYGSDNARNVIVAMGSVCDTIKLVVDNEIKKGNPIGMVEVHLYRPFSEKYFLSVLPKTVECVAVLDRTKEQGSGEPLYLDVVNVLKNTNIQIVGGRYGLSSKNTTPDMVYAVYKMMEDSPKNNFTIGICDDMNHTSLEVIPYPIDLHAKELLIYGFGSDGMVSASKDIMHIMGESEYVQGYFEYDSKKSGGVTVSHLRIGPEKIEAPYYVTNANLIVVTKDEYFSKYSVLEKAKENSILLINTHDDKACLEKMSYQNLEMITQKNLRVLTIDADNIALKHHLPGKISKIMEVVILNLLGVTDALDKLNKSIVSQFLTKGEDIVKNNQEAILDATSMVRKLAVVSSNKKDLQQVPMTVIQKMNARLGNELTVRDVLEHRAGAFPGGLTATEKRRVSGLVSKWIPENCIQCGMCSFVCPHAVIRPFLVKEEKGLVALGAASYHYIISVSEADCTGCGLCVKVCPGKMGKKALTLGSYDEEKQKESDQYFTSYENPKVFPKYTIKGSQLEKPRFEFSGACAGCGETAYIKLLTQLFGDEIVIANATGCSSIYGGSAPSTPYTVPWANSLFEDNAEFAYGMYLSYKNKRLRIQDVMAQSKDSVTNDVQELYQEYLDNQDNFEKTKEIEGKLGQSVIPNELKELLPYVPFRTVWAIGGDGWAYDIGFGGIDHVLSSEENIKVLVLDTEVYSNTGGQMSKSSHIGAVAEFADMGKRSHKKDLFRIAMSYPNCYVASVSLGANMMQTLKVFKEASEHKGPSIIIAYAPCIEQGIRGGMSCSNEEQKLAVDVGYTILMRYKPEEDKLYIDSKTPNFDRYHEFLEREVRYRALSMKDSDLASKLLEENKKAAQKRYQYYENLVKE